MLTHLMNKNIETQNLKSESVSNLNNLFMDLNFLVKRGFGGFLFFLFGWFFGGTIPSFCTMKNN